MYILIKIQQGKKINGVAFGKKVYFKKLLCQPNSQSFLPVLGTRMKLYNHSFVYFLYY